MEILNAKKGRKPLQYTPEDLDPEAISDEEYDLLRGTLPDTKDEPKLNGHFDKLLSEFCKKHQGKVSKDLESKNKLKLVDWTKHMSIISGDITLDKADIEDDFKRESLFLKITGENLDLCKGIIEKSKINLGRPAEIKYQLFNDFDNPKKSKELKPKKLKKKKRKLNPIVPDDDSRYDDAGDYEDKFPKRRHVKEKEYRNLKQSYENKNKKRPGKWARESRRNSYNT